MTLLNMDNRKVLSLLLLVALLPMLNVALGNENIYVAEGKASKTHKQHSSKQQQQLELAKTLKQEEAELFQQGQYKEGITKLVTVLKIYEEALGKKHLEVADTLNSLGILYIYTGEYDKALASHKRALKIFEEYHGLEHPDTATSLGNLASVYDALGNYTEAESLHKRALSIREKVLGPEHPDTAGSLNNLSTLYKDMGDYDKAISLNKRALDIWEKTLGVDHPNTVKSINNLASLYKDTGDYIEAQKLYKRALDANENVLGSEHPDTAINLNNLGLLHISMGNYAKAKPLFERALDIRKNVLGEEHPATATTLNNLAILYYTIGDYSKAKSLYERALSIREKVLGVESPVTATTLNNLAALYKDIGDYTKAKYLYERALKIQKKMLGVEHPDTAITLNNLSLLYDSMGDINKAKSLQEHVLAIRDKILGKEHPDTVTSLNNLAALHIEMGSYTKAQELNERALGIREKVLGPENPDTATSLFNLATIYNDTRDYTKASSLYERALTIWGKTLGTNHPRVLIGIGNLAENALMQKQWHLAYARTSRLLVYHQQSLDSVKALIRQDDATITYQQQTLANRMLLHLKASQRLLAKTDAEAQAVIPGALAAMQLAHDPRNTQSMVLTALKLAGNDPLHHPQVDALVDALYRRDKSSENYDASFTPAPQNTPKKQIQLKKNLEAAEQDVKQALAILKSNWSAFNTLIDTSPLTAVEAGQLLHPNEAILAYAAGMDESYLMVIRQDQLPTLHKLDITRDELVSKIKTLRQGLTTQTEQQADGSTKERLQPFDLKTAYLLYHTLVQPVESELHGITHIIWVPDSAMQNLPISTLLVETPHQGKDAYHQAHWLIRDYSLSQLPSLASLRLVRKAGGQQAEEPFVGFGQPDLQGQSESRSAKGVSGEPVQLSFASRGESTLSNVNALRQLSPLPFTGVELENLARRFKVDNQQRVFLKQRATETRIKALDKSGILQKQRVLAFSTHALLASESTNFQTGAESGLVLTPPAQASSEDDGYLTATEASRLTLNADWVLLSACNTGVVENKTNPATTTLQPGQDTGGLSSLAKSFFHAGSRNLLITQWNVFDPTGSQMVPSLFKDSSSNKSQRLQQAMLKIVDQGLEYFDGCLRDEDEQTVWQRLFCPIKRLFPYQETVNEWAHPYYWAPYVIIGDGI